MLNHKEKVTHKYNSPQNSDNTIQQADLEAVKIEVEKITERKRQISAQIYIPNSVESIWKILTNYEALPDFIPNLSSSRLLEHPQGGIRVEQVGSQKLLRFNFSARVVLDLQEHFPKEISFTMVEGDLKEFSGSWLLEPLTIAEQSGTSTTNLSYTVQVLPKRTMPVGMIEKRLSQDLRSNLLAVRERVAAFAN
ncbi:MAG: SRPBCC family protein [Cyanobacteria bacterium P01_A01_bin.84]